MNRSADSPEDDYIAGTGRPHADVVAEIEADERRQEAKGPIDVDYLRLIAQQDETDALVQAADEHDAETTNTRAIISAMALSAVIEVAEASQRNAIDVEPELLELPELAEALDRIRAVRGALGITERDIENAIVAKIPKVERGRYAGRPQKHTDVEGGWHLERGGSGKWVIDSRRALARLISDVPAAKRTPEVIADLVANHIGSIDTSWKVTELEDSLGGPILEPELDGDGQPVLITRGPNKGQPKMVKVNRLTEEHWGDREEGRDTVRVTKGEATDG